MVLRAECEGPDRQALKGTTIANKDMFYSSSASLMCAGVPALVYGSKCLHSIL